MPEKFQIFNILVLYLFLEVCSSIKYLVMHISDWRRFFFCLHSQTVVLDSKVECLLPLWLQEVQLLETALLLSGIGC